MDSLAAAIIGAAEGVTKKWTKQKKAEERSASAKARRYQMLTRRRRTPIKEYAMQVTERAYLEASGDGQFPAMQRQIMYAARRLVAKLTDDQLTDKYYIQTILPEYLRTYRPTWAHNVLADDHGHFSEPHTDKTIGCGTLAVRKYLSGMPKSEVVAFCPSMLWPTHGVKNRISAVMFVEKEGFLDLFSEVKLAERFDIGILSTKGQTNVAARKLADDLCGLHDIPLMVLRDFDKAGFSMLGTFMRSNDRYRYVHDIQVIDLGLRLADAREWDLDSEPFHTDQNWRSMANNLRCNGATQEEIDFLVEESERVELNAFTSPQLVEFLEAKFDKHGIRKVQPDGKTLEAAYQRALRIEFIKKRFGELKSEADEFAEACKVPALKRKVAKRLKEDPHMPWDLVIAEMAADAVDECD
ncbi:MAG: hypothetical protein IH991_13300 [Planctomycetes bacterium]|nr:hypothetical protein [Planctomycetota bacterium]